MCTSIVEMQFRKHHKLLFTVARRILKDDALAEDAVQTACLHLLASGKPGPEVTDAKAYVVTSVKNEARKILEARKLDGKHDPKQAIAERKAPPAVPARFKEPAMQLGPIPHCRRSGGLDTAEREELSRSLDVLNSNQRTAVMLRELAGKSIKETAEWMGVSETAAADHYRTGMARAIQCYALEGEAQVQARRNGPTSMERLMARLRNEDSCSHDQSPGCEAR